MREIKFRQAIFLQGSFYKWHYWGFTDIFVGPVGIEYGGKESYQYTGLKDKNGSCIFEGDIVVIPQLKRKPTFVSFQRGTFVTQGNRQKLELLNAFSEYEVIGNIYENPELLDKGD